MTHLDVDFVTTQHNRDVLANALEVAMPVGHVFVGDAGRHIEHDNATLSLDVVSIAQTTELLLSGCVPHVETDGAEVGGEG